MASDDVERASKLRIKGSRTKKYIIRIIIMKKKKAKEKKNKTDCEVDVHVSTSTTFKQRLNYYLVFFLFFSRTISIILLPIDIS